MSHSIEEKLQALIDSPGTHYRSSTALIRKLYPKIEEALAKGVSRSDILKTINSEGMQISLQSFEKILYRIRKKERTISTSQI